MAVQSHTAAVRSAAQVLLFSQRCSAPYRDDPGSVDGSGRVGGVLSGLKILVVEDDFIVAFDMRMMLEEQGAQVLGPAATLQQARAIVASDSPQLAVLDVNLNGEFVFPLAEELSARTVPFVFATAYADDERLFPATVRDIPRLAKPVLPGVLIGRLRKLLE
jgi:DNA-binding response OmpR family regulator